MIKSSKNTDAPPRDGHGTHNDVSVEGEGRPPSVNDGFRFGRMFKCAGHAQVLRLSAGETIGEHMTAMTELARADSNIPAGYTYFGQFVDHDLSFDQTERENIQTEIREQDDPDTAEIESTPIRDLVQARSPSLDLDSLYGAANGRQENLFNGPKFKLGQNTPSPGDGPVDRQDLRYDLPRAGAPREGQVALPALIGDPRNDENLAVAQVHLFWLRFHNHIVDVIRQDRPGLSDNMAFEAARDLVVRHYQHTVLHDFVRRFITDSAYNDVIINGNRKVLKHCVGEVPFMPLEFSVAAYRHGHSQVREVYDWNRNFGTGAGLLPDSPFSFFFQFSQVSGDMRGNPTLPTNWIADFRRLFDLSGFDLPHLEGSIGGELNMAKKIDPYIASPLANLPEIERLVALGLRPFANLAALNLRRGSMRGLPSAQDIVSDLPSIDLLTHEEMKSVLDSDFSQTMEQLGFFYRTPLWLYILLEAAAKGNGNTLGALGSLIVAETFLTMVLTSKTSIATLGSVWHPDDASSLLGATAGLKSIPELLAWVDAREPIIDPLQDARLATIPA